MYIQKILMADQARHPPHERSLPWVETIGGVTVVVEPKPHWARDMRAFRLGTREYCSYADWTEHGPRARFYAHISLCGDDLMTQARAEIAREIADGLWEDAHA
jgi:hypothetical protein